MTAAAQLDGAAVLTDPRVKAAGFQVDGYVPAREYLSKTHRPRYDTNLFGERTVPEGEKIRWKLGAGVTVDDELIGR